MTFSEAMIILQSRLRMYKDADTNVSSATIKLELTMARARFFNDTDFTERVKSFSTVIDQEELDLGSNVNHIISLYLITTTERIQLIEISTLSLPPESTTSAQPECFYILNDNTEDGPQIGLYPIPNEIYALKLHFKLDPARVLADNDDIMIDDKYVSGVIGLAVSKMIRDSRAINNYKTEYEEMVMTAKGDADGSRASAGQSSLWDVNDIDNNFLFTDDYGFIKGC